METKEIQENKTIVLKEGLEITTKVSVLLWDKINLLFKKFAREEIGEFEFTLSVIKLLLIDKAKEKEIDDMLEGDLSEEFIENMNDWGEKVMELVLKFVDAKKK